MPPSRRWPSGRRTPGRVPRRPLAAGFSGHPSRRSGWRSALCRPPSAVRAGARLHGPCRVRGDGGDGGVVAAHRVALLGAPRSRLAPSSSWHVRDARPQPTLGFAPLREHGRRTLERGRHPDRREGAPRAPPPRSPPRTTPRSGMDRPSPAPARTADSGRQTASRPKGGIPAQPSSHHSAERHGPPKSSASTDRGQRTADGRPHPDRREGFPLSGWRPPPGSRARRPASRAQWRGARRRGSRARGGPRPRRGR